MFDAIETDLPMPDTQRERETKKGPYGIGLKIGMDVPEVDSIFKVFKDAGCEITAEPFKTFWSDRVFNAIDPFGYQWEFRQISADKPLGQLVTDAQKDWQ